MKKDAYYFPHFCNARHDRKLKRVQKELGVEGYGIFFMILEVLRDQPAFKYPIEDLDLLADEFGTSEQKVTTVVCNYKLFDIDAEKNFTSDKMVLYLQPYLERSIKARNAANKRWASIKNNAQALPEHSASSAEAMQVKESKVKESKVKESKVKESKELTKEFDAFWEAYEKKKDKSKCFKKWKLLTPKEKEAIFNCVSSYVKSTPDPQYRKNPLTWLNGKCWEDEITVNLNPAEKRLKSNIDVSREWLNG